VFPNPRLCKALLDRITDRAHIIETGAESYRFRRTLEVPEKESIVGTDGVASTSLVQRKGLKRRPFLCTPSRLETQELCRARQGVLITTGGAKCEYRGGAKSSSQTQSHLGWKTNDKIPAYFRHWSELFVTLRLIVCLTFTEEVID
jgi:hypothetical protein